MKTMEITVEKKYDVKNCNECPYFKERIDRSVCHDSFDEPNYDWYCTHKDADNTGSGLEKYNETGLTSLGGSLNSFAKCDIPNWCPFRKNE